MGVTKGYKQSAEHIKRRLRYGHLHHAWRADDVSDKCGRGRALRTFRTPSPCIKCGAGNSERHHADGNTSNNTVDNIVWLCRRCHMEEDGRLEAATEQARRRHAVAIEAASRRHTDCTLRPGDVCPECGRRLGVTATRHSTFGGLVYVGCRKSRGGCGYNAGSFRK